MLDSRVGSSKEAAYWWAGKVNWRETAREIDAELKGLRSVVFSECCFWADRNLLELYGLRMSK